MTAIQSIKTKVFLLVLPDQLALAVLDSMTFVNDEISPGIVGHVLPVVHANFVRCDDNRVHLNSFPHLVALGDLPA